MKKSLNESLREEFANILCDPSIQEIIISRKLDKSIINKAFTKLLENKSGTEMEDLIKKGRAEFETYIINTLKSH